MPRAAKTAVPDVPEVETSAGGTETTVVEPVSWSPDRDDFLTLKGKPYLPARRRIQWMRGTPEPHPEWSIDTFTEVFERGKFIRTGKVEGGFAVVRASVFDTEGRLIGTGVKSEYSENFADFLEKAETGAIARALAVAGYGTESALDLDEGAEEGRPADSPVIGRGAEETSIKRGGHATFATSLQISRLAALSAKLGLGIEGLTAVIESALGVTVSLPGTGPEAKEFREFLETLSADQLGTLITLLEKSES